jgi:hypothetical protein
MVHCGYEPTAVTDTVSNPLKALKVFMKGVSTEAPMAPDIPLHNQRPATYVFEKQVTNFMHDIHEDKPRNPEKSKVA